MEARLDVAVSLIERLFEEFKELKESFQELKGENAILRKEILGIGATAGSSGETGMGLMEKTTLREIVEEIQFDVKALKAKAERDLRDQECWENRKDSSGEKRGEQDLPFRVDGAHNIKETIEYFPVVEIKLKTIAEQRDWMKKNFAESVEGRSVREGASFGGRTLQTISSSIVPNPVLGSTSCTLKLSNHLSYALTDPSFYFWAGGTTNGPSKVDPNVSEVVTFIGASIVGCCEFLCSFGISCSLGLTIYSMMHYSGSIRFGMAFTPKGVPTDENLFDKLTKIMTEPDIWMHTPVGTVPIEVIINHGKLHARGHMTPGPFSVIEIDIMAVNAAPFPVDTKQKSLEDGKSISTNWTSRNLFHGSSLGKIACIVEIGNCLNCTLRNRNEFFCNSSRNNFLPSEILPFYRERFLATDATNVEAIFSYEIESTDLCLVVALRVQAENNSFAVAFNQVPVHANRDKLLALMDPTAWKTHLFKKYAHAKDGEQVIEIRNIRASVKMTEDTESLLSIRVFAV